MKKIGVTGGIACGKSEAIAFLRSLGAAVTDADMLSRAATAPGGEALPAIRDAFGMSYFDDQGRLNRRMLGTLVFADEAARHKLEGIVHPIVEASMRRELADFEQQGFRLAFLDIPLLYEAKLEGMCDEIWVVSAPRKVQLARIAARDGLTSDEAVARIDSQMPLMQKEALADQVIVNDSTLNAFRTRIKALYEIALRST